MVSFGLSLELCMVEISREVSRREFIGTIASIAAASTAVSSTSMFAGESLPGVQKNLLPTRGIELTAQGFLKTLEHIYGSQKSRLPNPTQRDIDLEIVPRMVREQLKCDPELSGDQANQILVSLLDILHAPQPDFNSRLKETVELIEGFAPAQQRKI
jgi:hypothetical protein